MTNEEIRKRCRRSFRRSLTEWEEPYGFLTFRAEAKDGLKVLQHLYDDDNLCFRFLTDITAVHFPEGKVKSYVWFIISII